MENDESREQISGELCRLSKGYKVLSIDHKRGVLKTARGLLRIQRAHKEMIAEEGAEHFPFSKEDKNGC